MRLLCFATFFIAIVTQINSRPLGEYDGLQSQILGNAIENKLYEKDVKFDDFDDYIQGEWTGKQKDDRLRLKIDGFDEHNYNYGSLYDEDEGDYDNEYTDYHDYNYDDFTSISQKESDLIDTNLYGLTVINHQPKTGLERFDPMYGQLQMQQIQDGGEIHIHPQYSLSNFVHPEDIVQFQQPQLDVSQPMIVVEPDQLVELLEEPNYLDETIDLEQYDYSPEELEYLEELNLSVPIQLPIDNDYRELEYLDYDGVPVLLDDRKEGLYSLLDVDGDGDPDYLLDESEPELLVLPEAAEVLEQEIILHPEVLVSPNQTIEDSELILYETPEYVDELSGEIVKPAEIVFVQPELIEPSSPLLLEAPILLDPADEEQLLIESLDYSNSSERPFNLSKAIKELNPFEKLPEFIAGPGEIELLTQPLEEPEYIEGLDPLGYFQQDLNSLVDHEEEPLYYAYEDPEYLLHENATNFDELEESVLLNGDQEEPYVLSPEDAAYLEQEYPEVLEGLLHQDALDSKYAPLTFDREPEELNYLDLFEAPEKEDYTEMPVLSDYIHEDPEYFLDENDEYFYDNEEPILGEDEQDELSHLNTDYGTHVEEANYINHEHLEEPVTEYEYQEYENPEDYEYVDEHGEPIYVDAQQEDDYLDAHEDPEQFAQLQDEVENFEHHEASTPLQTPVQLNQTQRVSSQVVNLGEKEQYDFTESIENVPS